MSAKHNDTISRLLKELATEKKTAKTSIDFLKAARATESERADAAETERDEARALVDGVLKRINWAEPTDPGLDWTNPEEAKEIVASYSEAFDAGRDAAARVAQAEALMAEARSFIGYCGPSGDLLARIDAFLKPKGGAS